MKNIKSIIQFVVLLSVGILFIYLSLKQVAPYKEQIIDAFKNANYFWVLITLIISFLSHFLRAYRWNFLLAPLVIKLIFLMQRLMFWLVILLIMAFHEWEK